MTDHDAHLRTEDGVVDDRRRGRAVRGRGQAADRVAPHIFGKCRLRTSPAIAEGNVITKTWTP